MDSGRANESPEAFLTPLGFLDLARTLACIRGSSNEEVTLPLVVSARCHLPRESTRATREVNFTK